MSAHTLKLSTEDILDGLTINKGEPALLLKGLRHRESLTQVKFAKKIGVTQANLSSMENGHRSIGKEVAKRIEKFFTVSYLFFL